MNKKSRIFAVLLLCLMAAAVLGLSLMTRQMEHAQMDKAAYVTATPEPVDYLLQ